MNLYQVNWETEEIKDGKTLLRKFQELVTSENFVSVVNDFQDFMLDEQIEVTNITYCGKITRNILDTKLKELKEHEDNNGQERKT